MSTPLISIIIPVFNQWSYTHGCLQALQANTTFTLPYEVVVVDNASTDQTSRGLSEWRERLPSLRVETFQENRGFSPACNYGAQVSRGEYLLFLNNDTLPQAGWIEPLIAEVQKPGVGLVAPKLVYPDARGVNHAGYVYGLGSFYGIYHEQDPAAPEVNKKRDYQALLGACILMRRDLFFSVGRFSLDGLEDVDLCLKVTAQGLSNRYVPQSTVYHYGSVTLSHSAPGTLPAASVREFNQRWTGFVIAWDDYRWYIEDGVWPAPPELKTGGGWLEAANLSMSELFEAYKLSDRGEFQGALKRLSVAFSFWSANPMALLLRCQLLELMNQRIEARAELVRFGDLSFLRGPVLLELAKIAERLLSGREIDS